MFTENDELSYGSKGSIVSLLIDPDLISIITRFIVYIFKVELLVKISSTMGSSNEGIFLS